MKNILLLIAFGVLSRLIPHPPNATALTVIACLAGSQFSRREAMGIMLATLVLSDALLSIGTSYTVFGAWTLFTYSGYLVITEAIRHCRASQHASMFFFSIFSASFAYWLWTNAGVWGFSDLYTKNSTGFIQCYIAALPFLKNQWLGDGFWLLVILKANIAMIRQHYDLPPSCPSLYREGQEGGSFKDLIQFIF